MARQQSKPTRRVTVTSVNVPGFSKPLSADKYEAARAALLKVLPPRAPGLSQREMFAAAKAHLPHALFPGGATAEWWIKSVQLDLEAKGLVVRDATAKPLRWWRAPKAKRPTTNARRPAERGEAGPRRAPKR